MHTNKHTSDYGLIWEEKAGRTKRLQHIPRRTCSVPPRKATPQLFMVLMRMIQKSLSQTGAAAPTLQRKRAVAKITKAHELYE
ncbi:hypothetical protein E2320_021242 [Naja naja]|nr:hypothetical protein E2320_021242 [Naja naja]